MEEDTGGLQRRVTGRKRGSDRLSKTPKKARFGSSDKPQTVLGASKELGDQDLGWIKNSFMSNQKLPSHRVDGKGKDSNFQNVSKPPKSSGDDAKVTKDTDWKPIKNSRTNADDVSAKLKQDVSKSPHCGRINEDIFPNLTSTPVQCGSREHFVISDTPESQTYTTQHHQSFDTSDSVFADLDMGKFDNNPGSSARKSCRKKSASRISSARKLAVNVQKDPALCKRLLQHPISNLDKVKPQNTSYTGTGELICDSDDSLFGDSGLSDSVLGSIPVLNSHKKDSNQRESKDRTKSELAPSKVNLEKRLNDKKGESDRLGVRDSQRLRSEKEDIFISRNPSQCQTQDGKPKRRSIEFRAVSGSQLSFEEEDTKSTTEKNQPSPKNNEDLVGQSMKQTRESSDPKKSITKDVPKKSKFDTPQTETGRALQTTPAIIGRSVPGITPVSARSRLLRDRQKRLSVGGSNSVPSPASRAAQLKAEILQQALREAEKVRAAGTVYDIGPFYGLPSKVPELFQKHRGIKSLYDWQHQCLSLDAVKEGRNLIYSLPTSGGKTLVAEVVMLKELLCKKKDALFILPFVAIVQEKVKSLSAFALDLDFVVEEYAASKGAMPPRKRQKRKAIYIATIEKASSLVNSLVEAERISELGLVVVDELHMLGEGGSRGAILEMTLTKLMQASEKTQIIGMSATLNNISDLCQFLHADVYSSDFRPVELREFVKMEDTVYEINSSALCPDDRLTHSRVCMFKYDSEMSKADPDHLSGLVQEVIPNHSCLVFCPTKKNCENVALLLCKLFPRELTQVKKASRESLLKALWHEGSGEVCPVLRRTVPFGVAYHHSGLTMDERRLIEEAYLDGVLCLLTCTSTLAAGVNLPAKRVILRAPKVAAQFLSRSQYKQMVGRAGRAGLDSSGESILILEKKDRLKLLDLVSGPCDVCRSSLLYENHKGLRRLLLTTIGLKITPTLDSISWFLQRTLCYVQREVLGTDVMGAAQEALQHLVDLSLISQTLEETHTPQGALLSTQYRLEVTRLGRAVYKGSIDIDRGNQLYSDLRQAQSSLVVANYLHLLYLVTPYDMVGMVNPDWMTYLDQISNLQDDELKVVNLIGVSESYIAKKASGQRVKKGVDEFVLGRFYMTLILYNLFRQRSIWEVSAVFRVPRGLVQNILNGASTFAACIAHFCQELEEFWAYQDLFGNFVKKLSFCFMTDLIPLLEIPGVKAGRASQLYKAGYKTLQQVAYAEPAVLVRTIEHMSTKVANAIITAAKVILNEKVEALQEEAELMISAPTEMPPDDQGPK